VGVSGGELERRVEVFQRELTAFRDEMRLAVRRL
jgi:hypothetical protein